MRRRAESPIYDRAPTSKTALNLVLPLIARPLKFCFPRHHRRLAARPRQCAGYVKNGRCRSTKKVNTSQKIFGSLAPRSLTAYNAALGQHRTPDPRTTDLGHKSPIHFLHFPISQEGSRWKTSQPPAAHHVATCHASQLPSQKMKKGKRLLRFHVLYLSPVAASLPLRPVASSSP
jgi:hypothetical protein